MAGGGDQAGIREGLPAVLLVLWQRGRYWHEAVFDAANARVAAVLAATGSENRVKRTPIAISPHMLRHSFALQMLAALHVHQAVGFVCELGRRPAI
jgi:integrase